MSEGGILAWALHMFSRRDTIDARRPSRDSVAVKQDEKEKLRLLRRELYESGTTAMGCHRENERCAAFRIVWRHIVAAGLEGEAEEFRHNRKRAQRRARNAHRRHVKAMEKYGPRDRTVPRWPVYVSDVCRAKEQRARQEGKL